MIIKKKNLFQNLLPILTIGTKISFLMESHEDFDIKSGTITILKQGPEAKESVVKEEFKDAKYMNQIHVKMIPGISEEDIFSTFSTVGKILKVQVESDTQWVLITFEQWTSVESAKQWFGKERKDGKPPYEIKDIPRPPETRIRIHLHGGQKLEHLFQSKEPLSAVRVFIQMNRPTTDETVKLMTKFPTNVFTEEDYEKTLEELELCPSANLHLAHTPPPTPPSMTDILNQEIAELHAKTEDLKLQLEEAKESKETLRTELNQIIDDLERRLPLCLICATSVPNRIFMPCGHVCMCAPCAENFWRHRDINTGWNHRYRAEHPKCPICRMVIDTYKSCYINTFN